MNTRTVSTFGLAILLAVVVTPLSAAPSGVKLKSTVKVKYPPLTLQELSSNELPSNIGSITLGKLPSPGQSRWISRAYIMMQASSEEKNMPQFEGEQVRTRVVRPVQHLSGQDVTKTASKLLQKRITSGDSSIFKMLSGPSVIKALPGSYRIRLQEGEWDNRYVGENKFNFNVIQEGNVINTFSVRARIDNNRQVPVATQPISRGSKLTKGNIRWEERNINNINRSLITDHNKLLGMKASRNLRPGQLVTAARVKKPIVIERRESIQIIYRKNGITVNVPGESREEGAVGDTIKVINKSSETELRGKVVESGKVLVQS
ncbi:MAG: flagellar basal body P-ring formation chaperone FlgA [bacterium]